MANTANAKKMIKVNARRLNRNKAVRTGIKTVVKRALIAINEAPKTAGEAVKLAGSTLDRAAAKGVIHPNKAARRKSRLAKQLNKAQKA